MTRIEVTLRGGGECRIVHRDSGAEISSSAAPEFGGRGGGFSSTDLVAAALGSCIATSLEPVALRHGVPLNTIRISVDKALGTSPKRIDSLAVEIELPGSVESSVVDRLERAAGHCVVHRSLSHDVSVVIKMARTRT